MFCSKCGKEIKENAKFCSNCGKKYKKNSKEKNKKTSILSKNYILFFGIFIIIIIGCIVGVRYINKNIDYEIENDNDIVELSEEEKYKIDCEKEEIYELSVKLLSPTYYTREDTEINHALTNYIDGLKEYPNNLYAKKIIELFNKIDYENLSLAEKDFLDLWTILFLDEDDVRANGRKINFSFNSKDIKSIWLVGYNGFDGVENENENTRKFIIELPNQQFVLYQYMYLKSYYTSDITKRFHEGAKFFENTGDLDIDFFQSSHGINYYSEQGITSGTEAYEDDSFGKYGLSYIKMDGEKFKKLADDNLELFETILNYRNNTFLAQLENKKEIKKEEYEKEKAANAKKAPSIGMTTSEVEKSTWGSPDKINKDTYSWGTTEQWVYDTKGYIYFRNGIVTSISER